MFRRLQLTTVLLAWFLATGGQWDLVQTYAWVRMTVDNSRTMSLTNAVKKTFGGEMCGVCQAVNNAKQQENKNSVPTAKREGKVVLFSQPASVFVVAIPDFPPWSHSDQMFVTAERAAPPLPPPRAELS